MTTHAALLNQLEAAVGPSAMDRRQWRGWLRVLRYLERRDRFANAVDEADGQELARLLGKPSAGDDLVAALDAQARDGAVLSWPDAHRYLEHHLARRAFLLEPVLGRLAAPAATVSWA